MNCVSHIAFFLGWLNDLCWFVSVRDSFLCSYRLFFFALKVLNTGPSASYCAKMCIVACESMHCAH